MAPGFPSILNGGVGNADLRPYLDNEYWFKIQINYTCEHLIEKQAKMPNHTPGPENVFKDLGLPSPDERLAKAKLAYKINRLIADQGLTQKAAADFLGLSRSKMTHLRNGRLRNFTIDQLFSFLGKLDYHIEIRVSPKSNHDTQESIDVALI